MTSATAATHDYASSMMPAAYTSQLGNYGAGAYAAYPTAAAANALTSSLYASAPAAYSTTNAAVYGNVAAAAAAAHLQQQAPQSNAAAAAAAYNFALMSQVPTSIAQSHLEAASPSTAASQLDVNGGGDEATTSTLSGRGGSSAPTPIASTSHSRKYQRITDGHLTLTEAELASRALEARSTPVPPLAGENRAQSKRQLW